MLFPIRDSIAPRIAPVVNIGALSLAAQPQGGGVAWFAHIGGFVTGVAVAWWIRARGRLRQPAPRYQVWYRH